MRVAMVYANTSPAVGRGAGLIAGAVLAAGHELDFFDTRYVSWDDAAETVAAGAYDALLVSAMTMTFADALDLVRSVKERTAVTVLLGGLHATIHGAALLEDHPELDYLCIGEGESMVAEFLERLGTPDLAATENLAYRAEDGAAKVNPPRSPEDLAAIPEFPWRLFPETSIVHGKERFLYVNASRGCPFNCTYCCNVTQLKLYGKGYLRFRPADDILAEIARLREAHRPRAFYFEDEMLFFDKERATTLFRGLREMGVVSAAMARVEALDQELVDTLAASDCRYVAIGVECGDESFRREFLNRKMSNERIEQAVGMLKDAGIYTKTYNMIGYPVPDDDELTKATVAFTERLAPDAAQFTIFYPFPGTKMYEHCVAGDLIDPEKVEAARTYYQDSVLRGVSLAEVRDALDARFNPLSQQLEVRRRLSDGSLRSRYEIARAWIGLKRRDLKASLTG